MRRRPGLLKLIITPQARLMALAHGLMPGTVVRVMSVAARLMPRSADPARHSGRESESAVGRSPVNALGDRAVREYQEIAARDAR